ncbi:hypothetical protein J6590_103356, partial [Homalodisca vitripennis]
MMWSAAIESLIFLATFTPILGLGGEIFDITTVYDVGNICRNLSLLPIDSDRILLEFHGEITAEDSNCRDFFPIKSKHESWDYHPIGQPLLKKPAQKQISEQYRAGGPPLLSCGGGWGGTSTFLRIHVSQSKRKIVIEQINVAIYVYRKLAFCFEVGRAVVVDIRDVSFNSNGSQTIGLEEELLLLSWTSLRCRCHFKTGAPSLTNVLMKWTQDLQLINHVIQVSKGEFTFVQMLMDYTWKEYQ